MSEEVVAIEMTVQQRVWLLLMLDGRTEPFDAPDYGWQILKAVYDALAVEVTP